jgi:predicted nucleic acid-binding protein
VIVYLDTNCVIYLVERNPLWHAKVVARLAQARAEGDEVALGDPARLECLVGPLRSGNAAVVADYQAFFADPAVQMLPAAPACWERAARIRATLNLQALDSLHLAIAIEHGCGLFLTNDAQLARCTDIVVEVLT